MDGDACLGAPVPSRLTSGLLCVGYYDITPFLIRMLALLSAPVNLPIREKDYRMLMRAMGGLASSNS